MISVLLVDDEELIRTGLRMILESEDDIEVIGEVSDGVDVLHTVIELQPDVVLIDIRMPAMDGLSAAQALRQQGLSAKVVMLTTLGEDELVFQALGAGADGFLLKNGPAIDLVTAVRCVVDGDGMLSPSITGVVIRRFAALGRSAADANVVKSRLTDREYDVFSMLARGMSNAEIAEDFVVSEATVKTSVSHVLTKLQVRDRVHAVIAAYESGVVRPGDPNWRA